MSHADEGQLHAWLDGEFSATGEDEAAFEAHLENCALCLGRLDRARADREAADRVLAFVAPPGVETPPFEELVARRGAGETDVRRTLAAGSGGTGARAARARFFLGWAATVMLALGGGWMARGIVMAPGPGAGAGSAADASTGADSGARGGAAAPAAAEAPAAPTAPTALGASARAESGAPIEEPRSRDVARETPAPLPPGPPADTVAASPPATAPPVVALPYTGPPVIAPSRTTPPVVQGARQAEETRVAPPAPSVLFRRATPADQARVWEYVGEPDVMARITPAGVRIQNNRTERLVYLVLDADYAARARWVPCASPDCEGVEPGDATEVSRAGVPGWQGSPTVIVFWWHLVPTPEGGMAPDSIRSIPVPYTPG